MSVFSLETRAGNPVTIKDVEEICAGLGVTIKDEEKEEYKTLLAVFHESMESLMDLPGKQQVTTHR
jgi:amidase